MNREPVGVVKDGTALFVVCNDGTCWKLKGSTWVQGTPVPGTFAGQAARRQAELLAEAKAGNA